MSQFDLIIVVIMAVSAGVGWFRGGLREVVTLAAILGGFLAIAVLGEMLTGAVDGILAKLAALGLLFLLGDSIVSITGTLLVRRYAGKEPRRNDKIAGSLFGLVRGWLLGAFVLFTILVYHDGARLPRMIEKSFLAPALKATAHSFLSKADLSVTELSNTSFWTISPPSEPSGT